MPIVQVTALRQRVGVDLDLVSRAIADAVSRELGEEPSGTWVTWQTLAPGAYREGVDDAPLDQPEATHPPIVRISAFEGRPPELVARFSHVDLDSGTIRGGSFDKTYLGINWWASTQWKLGFGWGRTWLDRFGTTGITNNYLTRIQWFY